ncbi:11935_t:CDS:2 [Acaulospora morrowiae]|uniref:11935_t:CDS:1 n=1 Tax=Acaulospora morrowiae TaxID=94023 RepID=A0A9N9E4N9_9GLOM|nr:11935_t:CDS:2 [Acaulospora morrowiae]
MALTNAVEETHLVVFIHGLWGNPGHLQYFVDRFVEKHGKNTEVLNVKCNTSSYTYDGVDLCGDRIVEEIYENLDSFRKAHTNSDGIVNKKITKISFIGYSLGGLMARYVVGILYKRGLFDDITPMQSLTTLATPHLGIRRDDDRYFAKIFNWISSSILSRSGEQLQYVDNFEGENEPLLLTLSRPDKIFYKALTKFKSLQLFANVINDSSVPYWTSAIIEVDPFEKIDDLILYPNKKCQDIIDRIAISKSVGCVSSKTADSSTSSDSVHATTRNSFSKRLPRYMLISAVAPILPVGAFFILGAIATQGRSSRKRVAMIQEKNEDKLKDLNVVDVNNGVKKNEENIITQEFSSLEEEIVEGVMNLTNHVSPPQPRNTSDSSQNDSETICLSNFVTSSEFTKIPMSQHQYQSLQNLNTLGWKKYSVMTDSVHPHASIVCRNRFHQGGKDIIRYFVEELFEV